MGAFFHSLFAVTLAVCLSSAEANLGHNLVKRNGHIGRFQLPNLTTARRIMERLLPSSIYSDFEDDGHGHHLTRYPRRSYSFTPSPPADTPRSQPATRQIRTTPVILSSPAQGEINSYIRVDTIPPSKPLGYVSSTLADGLWGSLTPGIEDGQKIAFLPNSEQLDIRAVNSHVSFAGSKYFGGISGETSPSPNLGPGSANYIYIGATSQTPAGSTPMIGTNGFTEAVNIKTSIESAVWRYDTYTGQIQPQWVNTDGSFPNTTLAYDSTEKAFILTGDVYVYQAQTGSTVSPVTFTCVVSDAGSV